MAQTTVAKYMARGRRPPSQSWKTFLRNHAEGIASIGFFVVPTATPRRGLDRSVFAVLTNKPAGGAVNVELERFR